MTNKKINNKQKNKQTKKNKLLNLYFITLPAIVTGEKLLIFY